MSDNRFRWEGENLFAATTIGKGLSITSVVIPLAEMYAQGFMGLDVTSLSAGAGATIKLTVTCCATRGGTYKVPKMDAAGTAAEDIVTTHADGTQYYAFPAFPVAPFIKIVALENDVEAVTAFAALLTVQ